MDQSGSDVTRERGTSRYGRSRWLEREADHSDRGECITCGSTHRVPRFVTGGYRYVACGSCGLVRLFPRPDPAAIETLYESPYFEHGEGGGYAGYDADADLHDRNARDRLDLIEQIGRRVPASSHGHPDIVFNRVIVDVGCGSGYVLREAERRGWEARGIDVSEWARRRAHLLGLATYRSLPEAMDDLRGRTRVVTFFQSLEHLTRPDQALRQARELLVAEGSVVIETWDLDSRVARVFGRRWQQITPPSVIYLFSRRTLSALLARNGFAVRETRRTSKVVSVGLVLSILASKYTVLRPVERLVNRLGVSAWSIRYRLGDLITITAVRETSPPGRLPDERALPHASA